MVSNPFADEPGYPRRSSSERADDWHRLFLEEIESESYQQYREQKREIPKPITPDKKKFSPSTGIIAVLLAVGLLIFIAAL
jgi:hypothetical protein